MQPAEHDRRRTGGYGAQSLYRFLGKFKQGGQENSNDAIALVRIEDLKYRMVHTLSDGERQKVMIAKALAQETPVIFLDERLLFLISPVKWRLCNCFIICHVLPTRRFFFPPMI